MARPRIVTRRAWRWSTFASGLACALALATSVSDLRADGGARADDPARADAAAQAEALFVEGRQLLREQSYDAACPKLAESHRLDPATGTLLALALCYEGQGKTASAWSAYLEVVSRARTEKNAEREAAAKERAAALEPKLPRLVVELAPGAKRPAGLQIARDGAAVEESALGTAVPVDPGEHEITAQAPGKEPFRQRVRVGEGETRRVSVALVDASPAGPVKEATPGFLTPLRIVGIGAGAAGVVGLGVAAGLAGAASSKKAESDEDCEGNVCGPVGLPIRREARSLGDGATVAVVAGGVLAAAGLTLILVGGPGPAKSKTAVLVPFASPRAGGLSFSGTF